MDNCLNSIIRKIEIEVEGRATPRNQARRPKNVKPPKGRKMGAGAGGTTLPGGVVLTGQYVFCFVWPYYYYYFFFFVFGFGLAVDADVLLDVLRLKSHARRHEVTKSRTNTGPRGKKAKKTEETRAEQEHWSTGGTKQLRGRRATVSDGNSSKEDLLRRDVDA